MGMEQLQLLVAGIAVRVDVARDRVPVHELRQEHDDEARCTQGDEIQPAEQCGELASKIGEPLDPDQAREENDHQIRRPDERDEPESGAEPDRDGELRPVME